MTYSSASFSLSNSFESYILPIWLQSLKGREKPFDMAGGSSPPIPYATESHTYQHLLDPPERYPIPEAGQHDVGDSATIFSGHQHISDEEKKEHLVVARNSLELLSSILNSEAEPKPLKVNVFQVKEM